MSSIEAVKTMINLLKYSGEMVDGTIITNTMTCCNRARVIKNKRQEVVKSHYR